MRRFDLVAFDVDGTLVHHPHDQTVWEVLNERFTGTAEHNRERFALYRGGKLSYAEWVALDITSWRDAGATREDLISAFGPLRLVEGAAETSVLPDFRNVRVFSMMRSCCRNAPPGVGPARSSKALDARPNASAISLRLASAGCAGSCCVTLFNSCERCQRAWACFDI